MAVITLSEIKKRQRVDLEQWARITIEKWEYNIVRRKLIYSGDLLNSFMFSVSADADGDTAMVSFAFQYYVRMLDIGVGRGVSRVEVKGSRRKPYKVFNRTFYGEFRTLIELMTEKYKEYGITIISDNVTL